MQKKKHCLGSHSLYDPSSLAKSISALGGLRMCRTIDIQTCSWQLEELLQVYCVKNQRLLRSISRRQRT